MKFTFVEGHMRCALQHFFGHFLNNIDQFNKMYWTTITKNFVYTFRKPMTQFIQLFFGLICQHNLDLMFNHILLVPKAFVKIYTMTGKFIELQKFLVKIYPVPKNRRKWGKFKLNHRDVETADLIYCVLNYCYGVWNTNFGKHSWI